MSTQALLDKLTAERTEVVAAIEAEAAQRVAAIEADTAAEVAAIEADAVARAEKEAAQIKRASLARARQAGKLAVQTAKRQAFDDIMAAAKVQLVGDDAAKAQQFADRVPDLEVVLSQALS